MEKKLMNHFLKIILVGTIAILGVTIAQASNRVKVCHFPPDNPENFHTITVNENALLAHLAHGDLPESCYEHAEVLCNDGNACTVDEMDPVTETCIEEHPMVDCDDSNLCTTETCNPEIGCQSAPIVCDDGNACTVDACNPVNGLCTATPIDCGPHGVCSGNTGLCNFPCDGFICDPIDQCHTAGECVIAGNMPVCMDGVPLPNGTPCDDGNMWTIDDQCSAGLCEGNDSNIIVMQPSPEQGIDAFVTSVYGTPEYYEGYKNWIRIGGWGDTYYGLLKFNLEGLPLSVTKAVIRLYSAAAGSAGSTSFYIDRCNSYWDESVNWYTKPSYTQLRLLPAPVYETWYEIDITDMYNEWKSGANENYGVQFRPTSTNNKWSPFYSSDYQDDPSLRPKLVLYK